VWSRGKKKFFTLDGNGKERAVSIDRLNPDIMESDLIGDENKQAAILMCTRAGRAVQLLLCFR
jgi:hypothetical protein